MFKRKLAATLLAVAAAGTVAGCGSSKGPSDSSSTKSGTTSTQAASSAPYTGPDAKLPTTYPTPTKQAGTKFTVGFLNPVAANETLMAMQKAAEKQTVALGGTFITRDDQNSVDAQVTHFNELLAQGVDAIVVYPLDPRALGPSLAKAKAQGVPVIGFDVTSKPNEPVPPGYSTQIWLGRDEDAYLMAQAMASAAPGAQLGLIGIGVPVPGLKYMMSRAGYWAQTMGLHVLGEQDNQQGDSTPGGQAAMAGLLGKYGNMNGTIAFNDPTALGAASAARTANRTVAIVGNNGDSNGLKGVESGMLAATIQADSVGQGQQAVIAAYDLVTKQHLPLPKIVVRGPIATVTRANFDSIKTWDQQISSMNTAG